MDITVLGGFGVGKTIRVHRAPAPGETVTGGVYSEGPGGKASNQAVQMARLGKKSVLITAVGSDPGADMGRELWRREGVNHDGVIVKDSPTMVGFIIVDDSGENRIALAPGALGAVTKEDLEPHYSLIRSSAYLVVSFELNPEVGFAALEVAKSAGVTTVCNPAPAVALPPSAMSAIDVLVPNYGEACALVGVDPSIGHPPETLSARLREAGAGAVVITLGSSGAIVDDGSSVTRVDAVSVDSVVDTTGAGDSFVGALCVALHSGQDLVSAAQFAVAVAARTIMTKEVIPALPFAADLVGMSL